eukprot:CAMPEP_0196814444 /NCGR_PEP_ID=MMETSP1362-20130617/43216_1 /TAXON_ID=163516 /ORGANISM="Leptocylindrus danicus, Strain CCMP1856" /LENGTH=371 /DNA_ID=CAMNT_0042191051 /DNA_START=79 /DNA_END=1194 /DNA_ORIENTATION=-
MYLVLLLLFCPLSARNRNHNAMIAIALSTTNSLDSSNKPTAVVHEDGDNDKHQRTMQHDVTLDNKKKKERPRIPVLRYENEWVCVNKPASMTVYRGKNTKRSELVLTTTLKRQLSRKVFPVHRLDHRTSGALLLAFNSNMAGVLHDALRHGSKEYVALLRGGWPLEKKDESIVVQEPLRVDGVMKDARTVFECIATTQGSGLSNRQIYNDNGNEICNDEGLIKSLNAGEQADAVLPACTLVRAKPETGRWHQIRRHAYSIGMPIIGDSEHGDSRANRWWRINMGLNRLALHCFSLDIRIRASAANEKKVVDNGEMTNIVAPLPEEFSAVFRRSELQDLWKEAIDQEARLAQEPFDFRGGSFGRKWGNSSRL